MGDQVQTASESVGLQLQYTSAGIVHSPSSNQSSPPPTPLFHTEVAYDGRCHQAERLCRCGRCNIGQC